MLEWLARILGLSAGKSSDDEDRNMFGRLSRIKMQVEGSRQHASDSLEIQKRVTREADDRAMKARQTKNSFEELVDALRFNQRGRED